MKKKLLGLITVLAIAAIAAYNVNVNIQNNGLSDISLENIEALASEDGYASKCNSCMSDPNYDCHVYKNGKLYEICSNRRS